MARDRNGREIAETEEERAARLEREKSATDRDSGDGFLTSIDRTLGTIPGLDLVFGGAADRADQSRLNAQRQGYIDEYANSAPTINQLTPGYEKMVADNFLLGDSMASQAEADPMAIEAQRQALAGLQDIASHKGLTDADRQAIQASQNQNAQAMRGRNEAVMANMQERGMGGSGAALAGLLSGNQALGNANANAMAGINQQAQERALQAMQAGGVIGGQMRNSSFDEAFSTGSAIDDFNVRNMNWRRGVYEQNNKLLNQQRQNEADAYQQNFQNQGAVTGMRVNGVDQQNDQIQARRDRRDQAFSTAVDVGTNLATGGIASAAGAGAQGTKDYNDDDEDGIWGGHGSGRLQGSYNQ